MANVVDWNPWHGCHKHSPGCKFCYVYRRDSKYDLDASIVYQTVNFDLPIKKKKDGTYKVPPKSFIWTCFTSDFFLDEADTWRIDAWKMIKERSDCHFFFITKRIDRFYVNLPSDWNEGYKNVTIACTCENQDRADYRLPIFCKLPIKTKVIVCEPLLETINLSKYLNNGIKSVNVGGESGLDVRPCNYNWVLDIRKQCIDANVSFTFRQTGTYFIKDNKMYRVPKYKQHIQARKANINFNAIKKSN